MCRSSRFPLQAQPRARYRLPGALLNDPIGPQLRTYTISPGRWGSSALRGYLCSDPKTFSQRISAPIMTL